MPSNQNRLRAQDERISVYIKVAIGTVTAIIFACLIGFYAIYLSNWALPKPVTVPLMQGKSIEDVRKMAEDMKVHLIEHADYTDQPRGLVYRTDQDPGAKIRANRAINVWYSKGPEYVDVPNLVGMGREEAEQKLKDTGLTVGRVTPQYDDKAPINSVVSQDVTFKKRVFHNTAVDLVISDGPRPDYVSPPDSNSDNSNPPSVAPSANGGDTGTPAGDNGAAPNSGGAAGADNGAPPATPPGDGTNTPPPADTQPHSFTRNITLLKDGLGRRQVRVEYKDVQGEHPPVVNELHGEGDSIPVKFDYVGKQITLRIYYNDRLVKELTLDPVATRKKTL